MDSVLKPIQNTLLAFMLLVKPTITECLSRTGRDGRRVRLPLRWVYQNALPAQGFFISDSQGNHRVQQAHNEA
jgi:hypothetical protein